MIVEIILKREPSLELEGYEKIELPNGAIFANPVEKRAEIVVKKHPDGRVSVFTDKSEVIIFVIQSGEVIDIHAIPGVLGTSLFALLTPSLTEA